MGYSLCQGTLIFNKKVYNQGPKVVVIGGGSGLNTVLRGLKYYTDNITAIVTVSDYGETPTDSRGGINPRQVGNGVYLADDGWATSPKAAIGLMKLNGMWKYGVIADTIIGKMIVGEQLSISNGNESVEITGNGIVLDGGSITWKAPMKKSGVDGLENDLSSLSEKITSK